MVHIQHACNSIKAEAVEVKLFKPEFAIGEEEMDYLILAIIETKRIPGNMLPSVVGME